MDDGVGGGGGVEGAGVGGQVGGGVVGGSSSLTPKPDLSSSDVRPCTKIWNIVGEIMSPCFTPCGQLK